MGTSNQYSYIKSKKQINQPLCIWMTGLSGAGKTTIANALIDNLNKKNIIAINLDGDVLRYGINRDLGFTDFDRSEAVRRAAEIAKLLFDYNFFVIVSLISPIQKDRDFARNLFNKNEFHEIYISTPISECIKRDVKGLYKKAKQGTIKHFTGIDSIYETPINPELTINTTKKSIDECVELIISKIILNDSTKSKSV